jgi:tetrapyrrole methylase family protein/MazG family protein
MLDYGFTDFMDIIRRLRSREGCPWDREQTHTSLKSCLMEECYETIEAIDNQDMDNLCEELGDLLLQIALHSVIAEETKEFTISEVIEAESEKMIRRHPHVFGEVTVASSDEVVRNWDEIKKKEKEDLNPVQELQAIPKAFPAILRTQKVIKKTAKAGVALPDRKEAVNRVSEMLENLTKTIENGDVNRISEIFGDMLFSMINLSLILQLNAENSLTNATNKFINRFVDVFTLAERKGRNLCDISSAELDALWRSHRKI